MANVALIDEAAHPAAVHYYGTIQQEPVSSLRSASGGSGTWWMTIPTAQVQPMLSMSLRTVLAQLGEGELLATGGSVLICCHGSSKALVMPVAGGSPEL